MKARFIDCDTLSWVLVHEQRIEEGGRGGTTYHDPYVTLGMAGIGKYFEEEGKTIMRSYLPGIYKSKSKQR